MALKGIAWDELRQALTTIDARFIVMALVVQAVGFGLRGGRWAILLAAKAKDTRLPAFFGEMAGYMGNSYLPARAGEVLRTVLVSRRLGVTNSFVFGTVVAERLSDSILVPLISLFLLTVLPVVPDWLRGAVFALGVVAVGALTVLLLMPWMERFILIPFGRFAALRPILGKVQAILQQFALGAAALRRFDQLALFLAFSAAIWGLEGAVGMLMSRSFDLPLTMAQAVMMACAFGLSSAIPSTPGFIGVFQYVAVSVLGPFGFTQAQALAYVLVLQGVTYVHVTLWGLWGLWYMKNSAPGRETQVEPVTL